MKHYLILILFLSVISINCLAQDDVELKDGRKIVLKSNGQWTHKPMSDDEQIIMKADSTKIVVNKDGTWRVLPPPPEFGGLRDKRDKNIYKTVKIGNQWWMAENLNFETSSGSWCFDGDAGNCIKYGRLYDLETAKTVCPKGWHLPADSEWSELVKYMGGDEIAGRELKLTSNWRSPNKGATNSAGFSGLPGGFWNFKSSKFLDLDYTGYFWSSTDKDGSGAWGRSLDYDHIDVLRFPGAKEFGYSVRCVQD